MQSSQPTSHNDYHLDGTDVLTAGLWNRVMRDLSVRIRGIETKEIALAAAEAFFYQTALRRLDDGIAPIIAQAQALLSLGSLLSARALSHATVGIGVKSFEVRQEDRQRFAPAVFLSVVAAADPALIMTGRLVSFDRVSGLLSIDIDQSVGDGSAADWTITASAPADLDHALRTDDPHGSAAHAIATIRGGAAPELNTLSALADALASASSASAGALNDAVSFLIDAIDGRAARLANLSDLASPAAARANLMAAPATGLVNLLINGDFAINQRVFAGGALSAGVYGYDRWKAGTGGCTVSASGSAVTHTSGPLVQIIESPGLAGTTVTLSVEDLAGGSLNVDIEGETGTITAGAGRRGVTLTVPGASTGNVTVTLEPASGAVTYRRVQLNEGSVALPFERRHHATELALCQRYFEKSYHSATPPGSIVTNGRLWLNAILTGTGSPANAAATYALRYRVEKRVSPTIALYSTETGAVGFAHNYRAAADQAMGSFNNSTSGCRLTMQASAALQAGDIITLHYTADSEL